MSSATAPARRPGAPRSRSRAWMSRFESPVTTYYLLVGLTTALVVTGLIMVLSASSIISLDITNSAYSIFLRQLAYAGIGLFALVLASRVTVTGWKRLAVPVFVVAVVLQMLVRTPLGVTVNGNRNWISIAGFTMQPSELIKLGLVLTGGLVLTAKRRHLSSFSHVLVPYLVPIVAVGIGSVVLGQDLGTVLVLGAIVAGVLFAAGIPLRWYLFAGAPFIAMVVAFVVTSPNRLGRLDVWLGRDTDQYGAARQPIHGRYALADGGWTGVGLGESREKWGLLSEPHNDFIFAIIGEELGLIGSLVVLLLFGALALVCYRLAARSRDLFVRVTSAGIMTWIVIQALVNIGTVIGMLPVVGVPLPLVSSGGSSLITTMFAVGVLLSFARAEPGCAEALKARPSALRHSIAVLSGAVGSRRGSR